MFRTRTFFYLALTIIVVAVLLVIQVSYWQTAPYEVLEIKRQPVPVDRQEVRPGETVVLRFAYCKLMDIDGVVERSMVNHKSKLESASSRDTTEQDCVDNFPVPAIVPPQASPDVYHFHYKATYKVNPIRSLIYEWDSEEFRVVP